MIKILFLFLFLSLLFGLGCSNKQSEDNTYNFQLSVKQLGMESDPLNEAQINFKKGNRFYYGIASYTTIFPGAALNCNLSTKEFPGPSTSDKKFNAMAFEYVSKFNSEMAKLSCN